MALTGPQNALNGLPIFSSWVCPKDAMLIMQDPGFDSQTIFVHPWFDIQSMEFRPPFWTRHMAGVREAERARRARL